MKGFLLTFLVAALPAVGQWRFGSDEVRPSAYFGVGFSAPVNPLATRLDAGWNLAGGVGVTNNYVGLMVDAMFNDFGINHAALLQAGYPNGNQKFWALTVDPILHVNRRGPIDFYVTGGGGLYGRITDYRLQTGSGGPFTGRQDLVASYSVYKPGVDGGAGFAFNVAYSRVQVFAEARFHYMFTGGPGSSFVPVTVGVRF
jgi:hypothetical protein